MSTLPQFEFATPATLPAALAALGPTPADSIPYAGGVDLLDLMKERLAEPRRLVSLKAIPSKAEPTLRAIGSSSDGVLRIGALATLAEIAASPDVQRLAPALAQACGKAATPQVRAMATLGGNLCQRPRCWYFRHEDYPCLKKGGEKCYAINGENQYHAIFTDGQPCVIVNPSAAAVALIALDAKVIVASQPSPLPAKSTPAPGASSPREIPIADFFRLPSQDIRRENVLSPTDLITDILIPSTSQGAGAYSAYYKLRERQSFDWPLIDTAAWVNVLADDMVTEARVVLGAVAPVPRRATTVEQFLIGKALDPGTIAEAAKLATDGAKPLSQNAYKMKLLPVIVRRTLEQLATPQAKA